jgi:hypothetical protein
VAIDWAASQEWSNGSVLMAGASYYGATQLLAATRRAAGVEGADAGSSLPLSITRAGRTRAAPFGSGPS